MFYNFGRQNFLALDLGFFHFLINLSCREVSSLLIHFPNVSKSQGRARSRVQKLQLLVLCIEDRCPRPGALPAASRVTLQEVGVGRALESRQSDTACA